MSVPIQSDHFTNTLYMLLDETFDNVQAGRDSSGAMHTESINP